MPRCRYVALVAAAYFNLRRVVVEEIASNKQTVSALNDSDRTQIQSNEQEAAAAETFVLEFVSRYITDDRSLTNKLLEIQTKRGSYVELRYKRDEVCKRANVLEGQIRELEAHLEKRLRLYYKNSAGLDPNILIPHLRAQKVQFETLGQKKAGFQIAVLELQGIIQRFQQEISTFLIPFCGKVPPDTFSEKIANLQRVRDAYQSAEKLLAEKKNRLAKKNAMLKSAKILQKYFGRSIGSNWICGRELNFRICVTM